jgi:hypothetical protein
MPGGFNAIQSGHLDIHENHVGLLLECPGNDFVPGGSFSDDGYIWQHTQHCAYPFAIEGVIISN